LALIISPEVEEKLKTKHNVTTREVEQCFENLEGEYLEDDRPEHRTDPPTEWFIAPTNHGRLLKVVFVFEHGNTYLKTAHNANTAQIARYARFAKK
jgi:hypothetical protein